MSEAFGLRLKTRPTKMKGMKRKYLKNFTFNSWIKNCLPLLFLVFLCFKPPFAKANELSDEGNIDPIHIARANVLMIKYYLGEIQSHSHDHQFVEDTACKTMKHLHSVHAFLNCLATE